MASGRLLIVDDEATVRGSLRNHLTPAGYDVLEAGLALQKAGVIKCDVEVKAATEALIDTRFAAS